MADLHHIHACAKSPGTTTKEPKEIARPELPEGHGQAAHLFSLQVSSDRLAVLLNCDLETSTLDTLCQKVSDRLVKLKVADPPDHLRLKEILDSEMTATSQLENFRLVQGQPPKLPEHGRIEWADDFFNTGFLVDEETGAVDYRRHTGRTSVTGGELLATIIPPVNGRDGVDVYGKRIRALKAKRARIRMGNNISFDGNKNAFYATTSGHIRFSNEMLSVDDIFKVHGDIGLKTGHISHPGTLIVEGDILAGSIVEAEGDIEVGGVIEKANLTAEGDITVHGGITGDEGTSIRAGGSIRAKFILDADVRANGHVIVQSEIVQSIVKARGTVVVSNGRIVGGETMALAGIKAAEVGSDAIIPTLLIAGEDYRLKALCKSKHEELEGLESRLSQLQATVDPIRAQLERLPETKRAVVIKLIKSEEQMEASMEELRHEISEIKQRSRNMAKHEIVVLKTIHPEVTFGIKGEKHVIRSKHSGGIKAVCVNARIKMQTYTARKSDRPSVR